MSQSTTAAAAKVLSITTGCQPAYLSAVKDAVSRVLRGVVIAVPTDTIYGLACNADCDDAVKKLYEIKERQLTNRLAICVADISDIYKWCHVNVTQQLLQRLLPGQVTLVFERQNSLNEKFNAGSKTIAVRIPDSDFIRSVCRQAACPLALTSANISASASCLAVEEFSELWPLIDRVYDAGPLHEQEPQRLGSTIVDLTSAGHYSIKRKGCAYSTVISVLSQFDLHPKPDSVPSN